FVPSPLPPRLWLPSLLFQPLPSEVVWVVSVAWVLWVVATAATVLDTVWVTALVSLRSLSLAVPAAMVADTDLAMELASAGSELLMAMPPSGERRHASNALGRCDNIRRVSLLDLSG
ncbi:hypothetical protein MTO96_022644, partial [Rhipicephalus appendiculatus]